MQLAPEQIFLNGLGLGALYIMVAMGLTLAFGVMKILNFSHGELYMVGAYSMWLFHAELGLSFPVAAAIGCVIVGVIGLVVERGIFRPLRDKPFSGLLGAIGVMFILQVLMGQIFGLGLNKTVPAAYVHRISFFTATLGVHRLIVIVASFFALAGMWFFFRRAKMGRAMRACSQDAEAAVLQGVSLNSVGRTTMVLSGVLAGLAGALISPTIIVNPYIGGFIILKAFAIVIVGGMGSIEGTILAALIFGFMDSSITSVFDGTIASMVGLVFLFTILVLRPRGLLGREA